MRLYIDTNVIMDFLLDRRSSAHELIKEALKCKHSFIISDLVVEELSFQNMDFDSLFKILDSARKLEILKTTSEESRHARLISRTHYNDALHYFLAKRAGVDCLVTSNVKDFSWFTDLDVKRPDDLC